MTAPPPEEALFVERLRRRDERAFNELVRLYERRVYGIVFRMMGRRDEAEDVTQEVFVQVFKAIDQFRGDSKLSTWVFRFAVNLCKNRSKYNQRRHQNDKDELEAGGDTGDSSAPQGSARTGSPRMNAGMRSAMR